MSAAMNQAKSFHVAAFGFDGELVGESRWEVDALSPKWLDFARQVLQANGEAFRVAMPVSALSHIELQFTSSEGLALGTFFSRGTIAMSTACLSGRVFAGEAGLLKMFVESLRRVELVKQVATSSEPFGGVLSIPNRPLHVVVPWGTVGVGEGDHSLITELARHFAGAFFLSREQGVV
jgi:hypothetical protein